MRAAALLHIARVQTACDREGARQSFEQALSTARQLSGMDGPLLLEQAQLLAAAVAPGLLPQIPQATSFPEHFLVERLCQLMLEHGRLQAAVSRLMEHRDDQVFPFGMVPAVMQRVDEAVRLAVLRCAIQAWRCAPQARFGHDRFLGVFQLQWKVLPMEEATAVVRELVQAILDRPDTQTRATFDRKESGKVTSGRAFGLFQILGILRRLDPPLAERLLVEQEQLAAPARRYPDGWDSVMEEAAALCGTCDQSGGGFAGDPRDFSYMWALMQRGRDGDFRPAMEQALERYAEDIAHGRPNQAPREFWPSTAAFRSILYAAGKRLG